MKSIEILRFCFSLHPALTETTSRLHISALRSLPRLLRSSRGPRIMSKLALSKTKAWILRFNVSATCKPTIHLFHYSLDETQSIEADQNARLHFGAGNDDQIYRRVNQGLLRKTDLVNQNQRTTPIFIWGFSNLPQRKLTISNITKTTCGNEVSNI